MTIISSCQSTDSTNPKPIQFNPIQSNPIQSNPITSNPIQFYPITSNPIQFFPIHSYFILFNPMKSHHIPSSLFFYIIFYVRSDGNLSIQVINFFFILLIHNMLEKNNMLPCLILCGFISIFHLRLLPLYLL